MADHNALLFRVISIIPQTLAYGIYLCLVPMWLYVIMKKGIQSRSRKLLFAMATIMFTLSTMYWILSVVITFLVFRSAFDPTYDAPDWLTLFSAILLVNFILTDGVVIWRAWVLCPEQSKFVLVFPIVLLAINTLVYMAVVATRVGLMLTAVGTPIHGALAHTIDVAQMTNLVLSLFINILGTLIISNKAWKYRKSLMNLDGGGGQMTTPATKILGLLIESGVFYILIGLIAVISLVIPLTHGKLGTIVMPVSVQLAGMYPIIVLLLVDQDRSFSATVCYTNGSVINISGESHSRTEPMTFAPGARVSSGTLITAARTETRNSVTYFSLGSTLEKGDSEMKAGVAGSSTKSGEKRVDL